MEFITNELKLTNEELIAELQKEKIVLIGLKNTPYINTIIRGQKVELTQNENGELYVINKISNYKEYISSRDIIENATTLEKWNAYTNANSEKIINALSLIGKSVKVKGVQHGFAENSQTRLFDFLSSHENEIKGVIVGYDIPRDNFFVAFDTFEKINLPYNLASVLHSGNRSYMRTNCITYENTENLFTDILEIDNAEPVHEIITDTRGFSIDKNAFPDSVLGYTTIAYNETEKIKTTRLFLNATEARRNNYKKCKKCGLYHNHVNLHSINTNNYCHECCEKMERENKIIKCEICGKYERVANIKMVNNGNNEYIKICGTCATRYMKQCEECGKMHFVYNTNNNDFKRYKDTRGNYHYFCNECVETTEKLTTCVECGDTIYKSDNDYFNYTINGNYYCSACFAEIQSRYRINSYHFKSEWRPQKLETEDNPIYYGFELETENRTSATTEYLKNLHDTFPYIVFERDGSLYSSGAFETISEPLSMEFIKAHKDNIKSLLTQMAQYGATSHDNTTCGLHIHFTRSFFNEEAENKIITIFERFQNELIRFSRRKYSEIMHWTKFNGTDLKNIDIENIKKIKPAYLGGRYNCINLTNKKTIECRLFRGTLKYETFMACFELLDNIIAFVLHENNEKINKCKFIDILKYKPTDFLIDYCKTRNIIESEVE